MTLNNQWKPKAWIAITLGIFLQGSTFLYLNKSKLFFIYLGASIITGLIDWYCHTFFSMIFNIICPIHAYLVVCNYDVNAERRWYSRWWGIPLIYAFIIVPTFLFRSFLYEPFVIPASSMVPNINIGDHVVIRKWGFGNYGTYGISLLNPGLKSASIIHRGRVYVFYPPNTKKAYLKRVIGIPGDKIEFFNKQLIINGKKIETINTEKNSQLIEHLESTEYRVQYINDNSSLRIFSVTVPDNSYFVLGDNRDNSSDSRVWGSVPSSNFLGEVIYVFNK